MADDTAAELAKKLSNPVAALVSVPFQLNYDDAVGPADTGDRWTLNVQPVDRRDDRADWKGQSGFQGARPGGADRAAPRGERPAPARQREGR